VEVARAQGIEAWAAGTVEAGPKRVIIDALDVSFDGAELALR
jgi:phosphoribosylformylglycinamidine cyclo-ligase